MLTVLFGRKVRSTLQAHEKQKIPPVPAHGQAALARVCCAYPHAFAHALPMLCLCLCLCFSPRFPRWYWIFPSRFSLMSIEIFFSTHFYYFFLLLFPLLLSISILTILLNCFQSSYTYKLFSLQSRIKIIYGNSLSNFLLISTIPAHLIVFFFKKKSP